MCEAECFAGTRIREIIDELDVIYENIETAQAGWRSACTFHCPDGCGTCCVGFEPDVLESEALYLAAWMLYHQRERALSIVEGSFVAPRRDPGSGCFLFDPASPYHCTVYGGRCLICRLFGYAGDRGKDGRPRWKPCKFLPSGAGTASAPLHHQYDEAELIARFGAMPPLMADVTSRAVALMPDEAGDRLPLREALPKALSRLLMLLRFLDLPEGPDTPEPNPESPMPRAS